MMSKGIELDLFCYLKHGRKFHGFNSVQKQGAY